jgi:phospholipase/carboxylesterase
VKDEGRKQLSLVHRLRRPGVVGTAGEPPPLLLLLHGVGANELAMVSISSVFDPRFVVISARSPIEVGTFAFAWFHVTFTPQGPVIDGDEAATAWSHVARFIDEAVAAYGVDAARVFIAGFSQGGIVALATMLTSPEKVAGVVCMSGRLPPEVLPHIAPPERLRAKPVLIVHGAGDETLPVEYGRSAYATLKEFPLDLEYREFDMGHTTTETSLSTVAAWLSARLPR